MSDTATAAALLQRASRNGPGEDGTADTPDHLSPSGSVPILELSSAMVGNDHHVAAVRIARSEMR